MTLDAYLRDKGIKADFVKIDIEGFEAQALEGMAETLQYLKAMMIEVTENQERVSNILKNNHYEIIDIKNKAHQMIPKDFFGNIFAIKH